MLLRSIAIAPIDRPSSVQELVQDRPGFSDTVEELSKSDTNQFGSS